MAGRDERVDRGQMSRLQFPSVVQNIVRRSTTTFIFVHEDAVLVFVRRPIPRAGLLGDAHHQSNEVDVLDHIPVAVRRHSVREVRQRAALVQGAQLEYGAQERADLVVRAAAAARVLVALEVLLAVLIPVHLRRLRLRVLAIVAAVPPAVLATTAHALLVGVASLAPPAAAKLAVPAALRRHLHARISSHQTVSSAQLHSGAASYGSAGRRVRVRGLDARVLLGTKMSAVRADDACRVNRCRRPRWTCSNTQNTRSRSFIPKLCSLGGRRNAPRPP